MNGLDAAVTAFMLGFMVGIVAMGLVWACAVAESDEKQASRERPRR